MQINIITCHDVYNTGASLQAYALLTYLKLQGHEVKIIDYKPHYLSRHYRLSEVYNTKYNRPIIKQLYLLIKLPRRLRALKSPKKKAFDSFKRKRLVLTSHKYRSFGELKNHCPKGDIFIAGSDQIWNPLFQNGKDPSFFLRFVQDGKKIAYAASFAVEELPPDIEKKDRVYLCDFDAVSVRESSGLSILRKMNIEGVQVVDPVFLLDRSWWNDIIKDVGCNSNKKYIFVYDFDSSNLISDIITVIKKNTGYQVISYFPRRDADLSKECGPLQFVNMIKNAEIVLSNSFHAAAFSIIFHKDFFSVGRKEAINSRIFDLLTEVNLTDRYLKTAADFSKRHTIINWREVDNRLQGKIVVSKDFLHKAID